MAHVRPEDLPADFGRLPPDPRDERIAELEETRDDAADELRVSFT